MTTETASPPQSAGKAVRAPAVSTSVFARPREFLGNRFVYAVVSSRARGLSIGVNMNPDKRCKFGCEYCEVDRTVPALETALDVDVMAEELQRTLELTRSGELRELHYHHDTPDDLLQLRHVALSGDGEPTI